MKKYLLLFITICSSVVSFSQDFSNKGKDFYLCFPQHVPSGNSLATLSIYITSDRASTGTITMGNGAFSATFNINAGNNYFQEIQIAHNLAHISNAESFTIIQKSIRIKVNAGQPAVVAYAQQWGAARSAATLLLPVNVLGKKYYSINYTQNGVNQGQYQAKSQFQIIATKNNSVVVITPRFNGVVQPAITVNFPLAGDLYQYQSDQDLTGSLIQSVASGSGGCLPIAVFSGSSNVTMGTSSCFTGGSYDPLWQQAYPVSTWGKNFGLIPFQDYPAGVPYRVLASEDNTTVSMDGSVVAVLNAGEIYPQTFNSTPTVLANPTSISADKPICVTEYAQRQNCSGAIPNQVGDPDMVILNPIEQNIKDITVFSSTQQAITRQWVNVLLKTVATPSFRINGALPLGLWQPFPTLPGYSYLRESLVGVSSARINADSSFNAIAYGFGGVESYAYSAGTNVMDLYQQVGVTSQYGIEPSPSVCTGSPFKFKISLPYLTDSIYWDLSALPGSPANVLMNYSHPPVAADADSTTTVNGKQIYWYSLPTYYTFNVVGVYPVNISTFTANTEGCGNQQDIPFDLDVSDPPVAGFSWTSNGCVNQAVQFTDTTHTVKPLYHWYWDFGDPASGAANNTSGLPNPVHLFSAAGTYTVRFSNITTPGCLSDTLSKQITVTNIPVAAFNFSSPLCAGRPVTITDASTASLPGVLAKWYWNLGDGNPPFTSLNGNAQVVTYTPWGPRTVTLQVETQSGCQSTVTSQTTVIHAVPVPQFTHLQACLPYQSVSFTNTSTVADAAAMTYLWNFGDPGSAAANTTTATSPTHLYTATGTYSVVLTATNAGGCASNTTISIADIYAQAHGAFTVNTENCLNDPTVFTSTSTGSGSAISNYYWDFGDATPQSALQNPSHTYLSAGTYTIKHWVKTVNNCMSDTASHSVVVHPLPTANYNFNTPSCETRTIIFTDASVANVGTLSTWAWNFDDPTSGTANTSALANPAHAFAGSGTYNVKLTITTSKGCTKSITRPVTINARPQAGFIVPEVCLNDTYAQFTDTSSIADGSIVTWVWNFGDPNATAGNPNTSNLQNPTHSYSATGTNNVQLIVTSALGCKDTINHTLFINGSFPVAGFSVINPGSLCANDSVRITNTSTVFPGVITKTEIFWDDIGQPGVFETDNNPSLGSVYAHLYPNFQSPLTKNFTIRLRSYSGGVCMNDKLQMITVNAAPKVQFNTIPNTCLNIAAFQLTQASELGGVPGTFAFTGPGVSSTGIFDPVSVGPGVYTIHYTFTSNMGCRDSATKQIRVLTAPVARFGFGSPACETKTLLFSDTSSSAAGALTTWTWDFDDATPLVIRNTGASFTHTFLAAGTYQVKLFVTTADGCNSLVKVRTVIVNPQPKPNFTFDDTTCLPNAKIRFNNTSSIANGTENAFTYLWGFGDPAGGTANNSSTAKNPVHTYAAVGPYNVALRVTSGAGCIADTIIVLNTIHPQPKVAFDYNKPSVCIGQDVIFRDLTNYKDGVGNIWSWDFGDNLTSYLQNPSHTYAAIGKYDVTLFTINSFGCNSDTITKPYNVYPYPQVNAGVDQFVLEGENTMLKPVVSGNDLQYLWMPNMYLNSNTVLEPVCTPLRDITYTFKVTGRGNCVSTDDIYIKVLLAPKIPNTFSPNNDGINDLWDIQYLDTYPANRVQVFTRTGQLVFESRGYKTPWNGTLNGKPLPVDTYYYIIEPESGRKPITGYVTIVK